MMPAPIGEYLLPIICRLPFIWLHRRCQPHHHWCQAMRKFLGLFYRESVGERLVGWATYVTVSRGPQGAGQAFWPFFVPFPGNSSVKNWKMTSTDSVHGGPTSWEQVLRCYKLPMRPVVVSNWPDNQSKMSLTCKKISPISCFFPPPAIFTHWEGLPTCTPVSPECEYELV